MKKVIGTTEDRLSRFMSMCLAWQLDMRNNVYHPSAYYFTRFHIGKVSKELIGDLRNVVIDRNWAIDKMNEISLTKSETEKKYGINAKNRTIYTNHNRDRHKQLSLFDKADSNHDQTQVISLINQMLDLGYKVKLEKKI